MKKLIFTIAVAFSVATLFAQTDKPKKYTKDEIEQGENAEVTRQSEDEYGLVVTMGGINNSSGDGGYGLFGNPNSSHVNLDNNEIQAKNSPTSFGTLYVNYWGGTTNIGFGSTAASNVNIGVGPINTGLLNAYNTCLLYTSPSPRDATLSRMPSSA